MTTPPPLPPVETGDDTRAESDLDPQTPPAGSVPVTIDHPQVPAAPSAARAARRRKIAAGAALAVLAVGGVAGAVGYHVYQNALGAQPYDVLPSGAFAYAQLDLDPSLQQKVAFVRIQKLLPKTDAAPTDLFQETLTSLLGADDYAEIQDFVGKRVGAAVYPAAPGAAQPALVYTVQVTDEAKARTYLEAASPGRVAFRDGYALVGSDAAPTVTGSALAGNAAFDAAMDGMGSDNVARFWVDSGAAARAVGSAPLPLEGAGQDAARLQERVQALQQLGIEGTVSGELGIRDEPAGLELTVEVSGASVAEQEDGATAPVRAPGEVAAQLRQVPSDATVAASVDDLDQVVQAAWPVFEQSLAAAGAGTEDLEAELDTQLGITVPDDAPRLLGGTTTLALGTRADDGVYRGAYYAATGGDMPLIDSVLANVGWSDDGEPTLLGTARTQDRDGTAVVHAGEIGGRPLGEDAQAMSALADLDSARWAALVRLDSLVGDAGGGDGGYGVVGMTSVSAGAGTVADPAHGTATVRWVLPG